MKKQLVVEVDLETQQEFEREMTDSEFEEWKIRKSAAELETQLAESKATQKIALLAKLGISDDEVKLLFL